MVEVFKTNVDNSMEAQELVEKIHRKFPGYKVNFDLEDCDNILRVEYAGLPLDAGGIIDVFECIGYKAEVLPDEVKTCGRHEKCSS